MEFQGSGLRVCIGIEQGICRDHNIELCIRVTRFYTDSIAGCQLGLGLGFNKGHMASQGRACIFHTERYMAVFLGIWGFVGFKVLVPAFSQTVVFQEKKPVTLPIKPGWQAGMRIPLCCGAIVVV